MEFSSASIDAVKQGLTVVFPVLSAFSTKDYLSDRFTVGRISHDGQETEIYAPSMLEPGIYSFSEADSA